MADRLVFGRVNSNGTKDNGSTGFTCKRIGDGTYLIDFNPEFASKPVVVLTQNFRSWTDFGYDGGDTRDNAVLVACDTEHCKVITGNSEGLRTNRNFAFFAIGDL